MLALLPVSDLDHACQHVVQVASPHHDLVVILHPHHQLAPLKQLFLYSSRGTVTTARHLLLRWVQHLEIYSLPQWFCVYDLRAQRILG